jgi:putative tryptophan/tyrosine transport system substrate-binding protein
MRRRDFIKAIARSVAVWPLAARAQQSAMPVIGFLRSTSLADSTPFVTAFRQGLKEAGFVEGQNVAIELRFAEGRGDRLPDLVADLIHKSVAVIVANNPAAIAAKAATITVPIVFITGSDPVRDGLVASLSRPGGNITGVVFIVSEVGGKRLELLRQLVPNATMIGVLVNPNSPETEWERRDLLAASLKIGQQLIVLDVSTDPEIENAFATLVQRGAGAALIGSGPFLTSHRQQLVALAARSRLPTMYNLREFVADGGLISYGASITEAYRQAGVYVGQILKGEKPAELPVMESTKFEFMLNLKTAKTLGLKVPPGLIALADEVIE